MKMIRRSVSVKYSKLCFSYAIERNICFLTLCDKSFSKRQAYAYLEEIQNEFISQYGSKVDTQTRPYSFIEFGEFKILSDLYVWI